ncbi:MAG: hypothetical protein HYY24_29985 [Verrucomicrobia bacterium]|nr:hypothetical protein [Verrucomicrobiota bacterium]
MKTYLHLIVAGVSLAIAPSLLAQATLEFRAATQTTSENAGTVALRVLRSGDSNSPVTVDYATADGSAVAGVKYTASSGTLAFAAGQTKQTLTVPLINDAFAGGTTSFRVALSNPTGGAVLGARTNATVSITDPDRGITFRLSTYSVAEDAGAVRIGIARPDDGDQPVTVEVGTGDLSARAGTDYTGLTNTVTFTSDGHLKFVTIPILDNALKDGNRQFRVTLSNPAGATLGCTRAATVTILDNDAGFEFEAASSTVAEDSGAALLTVRRGNDDTSAAATVHYATSDGSATAGADYTAVAGTFDFAPGEGVKTLSIPILNDGVKEGTETFRVTLSNPSGGVLGTRTTTTVTIQDNDPGTGFDTASRSVWAGAGEITLPVLRGNDASLDPFTVDYASSDGTAKAGEDYEARAGTMGFSAGATIQSLTIPILRTARTGATRTFTVTLSNPTGGVTLGTATTTVRIQDNECVVTPPFASGLAIRREAGAHTLTWTGGGALQRADQVTGPWHTLGNAPSPHRVESPSARTFYRVTHPRPASVHVPSSYDPQTPMPLVLLLHGFGDSGQGVEDYMQFRPLAESRGFLYCHPDGSLFLGTRGWNADDRAGDPANELGAALGLTFTDDAGYLRDLIEEIARRFAVDRKRIFVTGRSNGGVMTYRMACQFADLVAGIASHAGKPFYDSPWCVPSEPVHVLHLHSLADEPASYWGGGIGLCDDLFFNQLSAPGAVQVTQT